MMISKTNFRWQPSWISNMAAILDAWISISHSISISRPHRDMILVSKIMFLCMTSPIMISKSKFSSVHLGFFKWQPFCLPVLQFHNHFLAMLKYDLSVLNNVFRYDKFKGDIPWIPEIIKWTITPVILALYQGEYAWYNTIFCNNLLVDYALFRMVAYELLCKYCT